MIEILSGIRSTSAALNAERTRMDVISENIANAHTTRGTNGLPYQRKVVVFETALQQAMQTTGQTPSLSGARIQNDTRAAQLVYQPSHPDADGSGMVAMPNINIHEEMADLIVASRTFEANLSVVKNARLMAMQALSIGKR
jgi:flagellar basal-body rod protein FlgC